jgi:hypothetical protein
MDHGALEEVEQVLNGYSRVIENRAKSAGAERLVIGNYNSSRGVIAAENDVAASRPLHGKSDLLQGAYQSAPGKIGRNFRHGKEVVTSTYSRSASTGIGSPASRTSSKYSSMASSMFLRTSARVLPCETQPGKAGTEAT